MVYNVLKEYLTIQTYRTEKRVKTSENNVNENNVISDAQFGFRKGRSTVDAIFILNSIVQNYINEKKRLYVVYVDMLKCFDSINRSALWLKLYKCGIKGPILHMLKL